MEMQEWKKVVQGQNVPHSVGKGCAISYLEIFISYLALSTDPCVINVILFKVFTFIWHVTVGESTYVGAI